jgi:predicted AAA+ superfamily ATPase
MYRRIYKDVEEFIENEDSHKNVLLIEGARQVGKSYMVTEVLKSYADRKCVSINLEESLLIRERIDKCKDFSNFEVVMREYCGFDPSGGNILFIDEAQESRQLGTFVRFMKEKWQHATVILTGSSMTRLFGDSRVPVGRVEYLRVYPYTFDEFLQALNKEHLLQTTTHLFEIPDMQHMRLLELYDQYLEVGGLPSVVSSYVHHSNTKYEQLRQEIYISQKDDFYRKVQGLKSHLFEATVKAVARNLASPFKLTSITDNHRDAKSALEQLALWHIVLLCEQHGMSPTSHYAPKAYLYDVGLAKAMRESSLPHLSLEETTDQSLRTALGGLVENAVYLSLLSGKGFLQAPTGWKKDPKNPVEVDFIYKNHKTTLPIEVKASRRSHQKFTSSLVDYLHINGLKKGMLVSAAPFKVDIIEHLEIVHLPVYYAVNHIISKFATE